MGNIKSSLNKMADPLQCCIIKPPNYMLHELPCNVDWTYEKSPVCQKVLQKYCADKTLTNDFCNGFCFKNEKWCTDQLKDKIGYVIMFYEDDKKIRTQQFKIGDYKKILINPFHLIVAPYTSIMFYPYEDFIGEASHIQNEGKQFMILSFRDINIEKIGSISIKQIATRLFTNVFQEDIIKPKNPSRIEEVETFDEEYYISKKIVSLFVILFLAIVIFIIIWITKN